MISKNIDRVTVTVKNRQINDGDTDIISEKGNGTLRFRNGVYYIMYKTESDTVMIKAKQDEISVRRSGAASSDMIYISGKKTEFSYNTPYGEIKMEIYTKTIKCEFEKNNGRIRLVYDFYAGGGVIKNDMEIRLRTLG